MIINFKSMFNVETNNDRLTMNEYLELLNTKHFDLFNPIHLEQCQNNKKSLVHYFVATCTMIRLELIDLFIYLFSHRYLLLLKIQKLINLNLTIFDSIPRPEQQEKLMDKWRKTFR